MAGGTTQPRWVGRAYAHFVLPAPLLAELQVAVLDRAVTSTDGWLPTPVEQPGPAMSRHWRRPTGDQLSLAVLGCYPVLATLGSPGKAGLATQRAIQRVVQDVRSSGGRLVADHELSSTVESIRGRWIAAVRAHRQLEEMRPWLNFRRCGCGARTGYTAPHCRACGHRFSPAEDVERDDLRRHAVDVVEGCTATLESLGRGDGLLPDWPPAVPAPRPEPLTAPPPLQQVVH